MAITRVAQIDTLDAGTGGGGGEDVNFNVTATHAAGNHVLIALVINQDTTIATSFDSRGNTYATDVTGPFVSPTNTKGFIVRGNITTALQSGDTITIRFTTFAGVGGVATEFSGLASASVLDRSTSQIDSGTAHTSGLAGTTTQADELLWGVHAMAAGSGTWTPDGSWVEENDSIFTFPNRHLAVQYQIVSSASDYESSGDSTVSASASNLIATYKSATGATAPTLRTVQSNYRWG